MASSGASVSAVIQIPPGAGEGDIRAVRIEDLAAAPADELIHVAGVVGEQHERLEVFDRRAGVVTQARQREIDAAGVKVRQRIKLGGVDQMPSAVSSPICDSSVVGK